MFVSLTKMDISNIRLLHSNFANLSCVFFTSAVSDRLVVSPLPSSLFHTYADTHSQVRVCFVRACMQMCIFLTHAHTTCSLDVKWGGKLQSQTGAFSCLRDEYNCSIRNTFNVAMVCLRGPIISLFLKVQMLLFIISLCNFPECIQ